MSGALEQGAVKTLRVRTMTEAKEVAAAGVVHDSTAESLAHRPHGKRFGALVHAVLAVTALDAHEAMVRRAAEAHARSLLSPAEEVDAAVRAVVAALAHPLLERARRATACRRESAVIVRIEDGSLVEGVLDLAFREEDGWTVVDFKTDVELASRKAAYEAQVALYARAVTAATGEPARAVLLSV